MSGDSEQPTFERVLVTGFEPLTEEFIVYFPDRDHTTSIGGGALHDEDLPFSEADVEELATFLMGETLPAGDDEPASVAAVDDNYVTADEGDVQAPVTTAMAAASGSAAGRSLTPERTPPPVALDLAICRCDQPGRTTEEDCQ